MTELPLKGITVIDTCIYWAGPMATCLLADLGADVIKIESIQHLDHLRLLGGWPTPDGYEWSAAFNGTNRNKYGITLNLNHEKGRELFKELVRISDVVAENFSPRVMENWNLTYSELTKINRELIMLSMPGFGTTGPLRNYVTFGPNIEMVSGMPTISGYPGGAPMMTGYIADPAAGLMGVVAVMTALQYRHRTGKGQYIDISQMEAITNFMAGSIMDYNMNRRMQPRRGNRHPYLAPYGVYPCKGDDQWATITVSSDEQWKAFCHAMGDPDWTKEARFSDNASRHARHDELDELIGQWTGQWDKHEVMAIMQRVNIASGPVLSYADVLSDTHLQERDYFETVTRPITGTHPQHGFPVKFSETPARIRKPAPTLGEDNEYVLKKYLGLTDEDMKQLEREEVIGTKPQGWALSMDADEAISKIRSIHEKGDTD